MDEHEAWGTRGGQARATSLASRPAQAGALAAGATPGTALEEALGELVRLSGNEKALAILSSVVSAIKSQ